MNVKSEIVESNALELPEGATSVLIVSRSQRATSKLRKKLYRVTTISEVNTDAS